MTRVSKETGQLWGGVAVESLVTDKPTGAVHDALLAKAVVFDNGRTRVAVVTTDTGNPREELMGEVRKLLGERSRVPVANVIVNASHNHRTHGQIAENAAERIVEAVCRAEEAMVPVRIGVARGREDRVTMNRRIRLKNGKAWTIRRANPSPPDEEVAGVGPLDPEIGVLRVDRVEGGTLAVVYNFACHPYAGVPSGGATADLPGFASRVVEGGMAGEEPVALFVQGAAGDITPIRYKDWHVPQHTEELGTMLGLSVLEAARKVAMREDSRLEAVSETIELPRRGDLKEMLDAIESEQEEILKYYTGVTGTETSLNFKTFLPLYLKHLLDAEHPSYASYLYLQEEKVGRADLKHLDEENRERVMRYLESIRKMEQLIRLCNRRRLVLEALEKGESGPLKAEIHALRIGDFVLVSFPGEAFCQVGLRIKEQSQLGFTFVAGYSNGSVGYAPTAEAYGDEAYEDTLTRLAPEWQGVYEKKALELIGKLG